MIPNIVLEKPMISNTIDFCIFIDPNVIAGGSIDSDELKLIIVEYPIAIYAMDSDTVIVVSSRSRVVYAPTIDIYKTIAILKPQRCVTCRLPILVPMIFGVSNDPIAEPDICPA